MAIERMVIEPTEDGKFTLEVTMREKESKSNEPQMFVHPKRFVLDSLDELSGKVKAMKGKKQATLGEFLEENTGHKEK